MDGALFPSSRLSTKARERVQQIISSLETDKEQTDFLNILIKNLITTSRLADNAWGARAMGQLLLRMYPHLVCTEDVLGTETHPGAGLSVIWLFCQTKSVKSLMSVLFWIVLPRLKQKKVAECLPKLLAEITSALDNEKDVQISKTHVLSVIFYMDETKATRPSVNALRAFLRTLQPHIKPAHTWIEDFVPLLNQTSTQYALPIILQAIEEKPERAAQELRRISDLYRLQVELILESCPESTLSAKYRKIV